MLLPTPGGASGESRRRCGAEARPFLQREEDIAILGGTDQPQRKCSLAIADEFLRALPAASTSPAIRRLLGEVARDLGFRHFAMIHHDDLASQKPWHVDIRDYPSAIAERIVGQRLDYRDPIIRGCAFADSAFIWSDLPRIIALDGRDRARLEHGAREGLNQGITVPCWSRGDCMGSCTFAGLANDGDAACHLGAIQLIGIFGFQHARRVCRGGDPPPGPRPRLNPRPRDCIVLAGRGLSNKEIARALAITPRTVDGHPTVKPVSLVADAIRDVTAKGDIVIDGFMGSDTTILAAERAKRTAYGIEIEPAYVDVAIRRWEKLTGKEAVLMATGQAFKEVALERAATTDTPDSE